MRIKNLLSASVFALSSAFASAVIAEPSNSKTITIPADSITKASPGKILVGVSTVLLIDISSSVDANENALMLGGIREALLDKGRSYDDCVSITAVRFASSAKIGDTFITCNRGGIEEFILHSLIDKPDVKPSSAYGIGIWTNVEAGLQSAEKVFAADESRGIQAMRRSIIIIGDGPANQGNKGLSQNIIDLATRFGVTSYGVPIEDAQGKQTASAQQYYMQQLITPPGLTYRNQPVFGNKPLPVTPGQFLPAARFEDVKHAVSLALDGAGF
jgi:hypothetical protein